MVGSFTSPRKLGGARAVKVAALLLASAFVADTAQAQMFATLSGSGAPTISKQGFSQDMVAPGASQSRLQRQIVNYPTAEAAGTIIIDTPNTYLYFVLGGGKAIRYGVGVGREGFTWSGVKTIERKSEWPDWLPPADMLARQPYLPRFVAGGPGNPLGARAMYLSGSVYRIHGTNKPSSIGQRVSSGCIRMLNEDVVDLYARARVGTKVIVLPMGHRQVAMASLPSATDVLTDNLR
jgi:lipoprotein-anchoring transpeptidase ErfK/SrfK